MAERFERSVTTTIDDLYTLAHKNADFETIEQGLIKHPEWLTQIPHGRKWAIIHQIVYYGVVDQLNRLLVLQMQNPEFRLLSKTLDNKTVLDIAREQMRKNEAMYERIERLATMDDLLTNAKARNWKACQDILQKTPDIVNEKPPYRRFYFIHHIAYIGNRKVFDDFNQRYQFDLNLLTSDDKSVVDLANDQRYYDFAQYIDSLKEKHQPKETSEQFSRESRVAERARSASFIAASTSSEPDATPVQNSDTPAAIVGTGLNLIDSLTCPLSRKILKVPVVASDGYTYEKENILEYFKTNDKSPITNEVFKDKELKPNFTIERILKQFASRPSLSSSTSPYYKVQPDDTLTKIAEKKGFSLDEIKGANPDLKDFDRLGPGQVIKLPLVQRLIGSVLEKEDRVSDDSVTVFQHFDSRSSEPTLIPNCAPDEKLAAVKERLHAVFIANDTNGDGFISLEEFDIYLSKLNLEMNHEDVKALFDEIDRKINTN